MKNLFDFNEENMLNTIIMFLRNDKRILQYRPDYLLKDLDRVLKKLGVEYRVRVVALGEGEEVVENNEVERATKMIKTKNPNKVSISIWTEGGEWSFDVMIDPAELDQVFGFMDGYEILRNIAKENRKEDEFEELIKKTITPLNEEITNISRLVKEVAKANAQTPEEAINIRDEMVEKLFIIINTIALKLDDLYITDSLQKQQKHIHPSTVKTPDQLAEYTGWFMINSFVDCLNDDDKLILSFITARVMFTNALVAILIRKMPKEVIELVEKFFEDQKNRKELN